MKFVTAKRLRRIRILGGKILDAVGLGGFGRRHLRGLRRRITSKEQELDSTPAHRLSMEPLIESLRAVATTVRPYETDTSSAPRVLLFTGHGMWSRATPLVDGVLFHALRERGAECTAVLCGAALPACHVEMVNTHPPEALLSRGRPRICDSCVGNGTTIYDTLGVSFRTMSGVLDADDYRRAKEIVSGIPYEAYFEHRDDGVALGAHARSSIMRYLLSGRLMDDPIDRAVAGRFMVSSQLVLQSARRLIKELEPDVIVANHGIYMMAGVYGDVARARGVRTVAWNRGYRKNTLVFAHGTSHHYEMMNEPTSRWDQRPLTTDERDRIREYLVSRSHENIDFWMNYQPQPITDRDVLIRTLGLDPSRPTVALFTNVNWDAQIAYPNNAFADQLSWLIRTVEHFRKRPEVQLVIRVHPAEAKGLNVSRQRMADEIRAPVGDLPENVHVIPAESDLSSYTLAELIDAGIVFASKFGIEMAVRGIPVVVAGNAWIRGKGFSHDASSPDEYDRILGEIERLPRMSPELVERAYMYANHFLFRRSIPIPVDLGDPREDTATVDLQSLDELLPGKNRAIDVICSGILNGTPFIIDELPAGEYARLSRR